MCLANFQTGEELPSGHPISPLPQAASRLSIGVHCSPVKTVYWGTFDHPTRWWTNNWTQPHPCTPERSCLAKNGGKQSTSTCFSEAWRVYLLFFEKKKKKHAHTHTASLHHSVGEPDLICCPYDRGVTCSVSITSSCEGRSHNSCMQILSPTAIPDLKGLSTNRFKSSKTIRPSTSVACHSKNTAHLNASRNRAENSWLSLGFA